MKPLIERIFMTSLAVKQVFVDTNILVFANVSSSPFHERAKSKLIELSDEDVDLYISNQVIREYLSVLSRTDANGNKIPIDLLIKDVERLRNEFNVLYENKETIENLQMLLLYCPTGGKQVHDANIVATMIANDVKVLLTHNVGDFERFSDFISTMTI